MADGSRRPVGGQRVLITGGARGIGRATATAFATAGAQVAIGDLDLVLAEETAAEIASQSGARVVAFHLDVTDPSSFATFVKAAEDAIGPADVLVNNAGIMPTGLFADEDPAMTRRMIDINLGGVINGSRLAVQRFVPRGRGTIVNVASLAGVSGFPGVATYCATKHAVVGFSAALSQEVRQCGLQVTVILPGVVRTELSAGASVPSWMVKLSTVEPEDVGRAVVAAVGSAKARVTVPSVLGVMLFVMGLLPTRLRRWAEHISGSDRAYVTADPLARAIYHRRVTGQGR